MARIAQTTTMLEPEERQELLALADQEERSLSDVTRFLVLRGLAAFKRDGKLIEKDRTIQKRK